MRETAGRREGGKRQELFWEVFKIGCVRDSMVKSLKERAEKLLSRTEAMVLLCSKASTYWSMIKFGFNIPLVLTSSAMLIINSILFRRLGQQFLLLSGQIENDNELTENDFNIMMIKYENLINECLFEEIPSRYKAAVAESYKDRHVPLQLNGGMPRQTREACKGDVVVPNSNSVVALGNNIV